MPDLGPLSILANPWFVACWYAIGAVGALWVLYDEYKLNTPLPAAIKWAFPIIVFFFSVIGIALYLWSARPSDIGDRQGKEKKQAYKRKVASSTFSKVTGSVIHCVGGDGLGIITAMVIARLANFSFWQEYWFEYAVGFAFGWFIFQYKAMRMMAPSAGMALWMGGRAEFFSMMTVMAGMGLVMGAITPLVVGEQPKPYTWGFWGFAALGLLVGFIVTYPMNYWLVKIGWKHGMH